MNIDVHQSQIGKLKTTQRHRGSQQPPAKNHGNYQHVPITQSDTRKSGTVAAPSEIGMKMKQGNMTDLSLIQDREPSVNSADTSEALSDKWIFEVCCHGASVSPQLGPGVGAAQL